MKIKTALLVAVFVVSLFSACQKPLGPDHTIYASLKVTVVHNDGVSSVPISGAEVLPFAEPPEERFNSRPSFAQTDSTGSVNFQIWSIVERSRETGYFAIRVTADNDTIIYPCVGTWLYFSDGDKLSFTIPMEKGG